MAAGHLKELLNPWGTRLRWVVLLILMGFGSRIPAQTIWNTGTGNWFTPGNWTPNGTPTNTTDVQINNGGTAQVTTAGAVARTVYLGNGVGESGSLVKTRNP